jgi:cobalamin biosynthesis protein CobD/CbiB
VRLLRRWPPLVWILVYVASLLVLMGTRRPDVAAIGLAMLMAEFVLAVYLALRHGRRHAAGGQPPGARDDLAARPPRAAWHVGRDACPTCGEPLTRDGRRSAAAAHVLQAAGLGEPSRLRQSAESVGGRWP